MLLNLIVLAPESVAAGWKQWEQELKAAALPQSQLKNRQLSTLKFSVLGPIIPNGVDRSRASSLLLVLPIIKALSILVVLSP